MAKRKVAVKKKGTQMEFPPKPAAAKTGQRGKKECPSCHNIVGARQAECPSCHHIFKPKKKGTTKVKKIKTAKVSTNGSSPSTLAVVTMDFVQKVGGIQEAISFLEKLATLTK